MIRTRIASRKGAKTRPDVRPERAFPIVAVIVVFGSLLGIVVIQTFIVQNRVQLDGVNSDLAEAQELNQRLWLQVIELESPERILQTAVTELGMVRPAERTYLPGIDPSLEIVPLPPTGDPFGPGPLPEFVATVEATSAVEVIAAESATAEDAAPEEATPEEASPEEAE